MRVKSVFLCLLFLFFSSCLAFARTASDWNQLTGEAAVFSEEGQFSEAFKLAREALDLARKTCGEEHPRVARSLDNLSEFYRASGDFQSALNLKLEALAIREKLVGKDHPLMKYVLSDIEELRNKIN